MRRKLWAFAVLALAPMVVAAAARSPQQTTVGARAFVDAYCVTCHGGSTGRTVYGAFRLDSVDPARPRKNPEVWEKVLLKLRSGMEPRRISDKTLPDRREIDDFVASLEMELDRDAPPYWPDRGVFRLNRTQYGNAIRGVLGFEVDARKLLPVDDSSFGFDTMPIGVAGPVPADTYIAAASKISRAAMETSRTDSATRRAIFVCQPSEANELDCMRQILSTLARRAFRRPAATEDVNALMTVYRNARRDANTERGLEAAIKAILSDPKFLYRFEYEPRNVAHGQSYRITDLELASRLSFFLWSAPPDDQLIEVAAAGRLHDPIVLERETRRMLNDPRSEALALNFAGQWFRVANLESSDPSAEFFPSFDEELRQAMRRESQLFFDSIVREDRNVIDLLTANYTFVNERLARHYGIPNVSGAEFRRVALSPEFEGRQGLLGKAAILTVTSRLDRTSPVTRGTWVSGILLGIHPPPPPPNVPALKPRWTEPNPPSMRELMIQHRVRPDCATCHDLFEAFGIALENFDGIGAWRTRFSGKDLDVSGTLMDGTKIKTLTDLRVALVGRSDQFIQTLTNKLFIYALGRGVDAGDMPVIRSITRDASRDNNRFSRIVVSFVTNPVFQMNTKE